MSCCINVKGTVVSNQSVMSPWLSDIVIPGSFSPNVPSSDIKQAQQPQAQNQKKQNMFCFVSINVKAANEHMQQHLCINGDGDCCHGFVLFWKLLR